MLLVVFLSWILVPCVQSQVQPDELGRQVTAAIQAGDAREITANFNAMVDLNLPGIEDSYGKAQAERILRDFFAKYPVKSYKVTKSGKSNDGSRFVIGKLESGDKSFRVFYLIKKNEEKSLIHQFQVQEEK